MEENGSEAKIEQRIKSVAVIGTGSIGSGIALTCALKNVPVSLIGLENKGLVEARNWTSDFLERGVSKGLFERSKVYEIAGNLCFAIGMDPVLRADLIIECISGDVGLKKMLFADLSISVKEGAIVATNTSIHSIRDLAQEFSHSELFMGTHFFNPVPVMKLVEVVATPDTCKQALNDVMDFCMRIGKQPVLTKDQPGLLVNRMHIPFILHAMRLYQEGNAPEDIDMAMQLGLGHKVGPLRLADSIGLDVIARMADQLFDYYKDERYALPDVLKQHIERGRLGKKSGSGFFRY